MSLYIVIQSTHVPIMARLFDYIGPPVRDIRSCWEGHVWK